MKHVEIHTDGACLGNPGPGGWAALLRYGQRERELAGGLMGAATHADGVEDLLWSLAMLPEFQLIY